MSRQTVVVTVVSAFLLVFASGCGNQPGGSPSPASGVQSAGVSPAATVPTPPEGMPPIRDISSLLLPADEADNIAQGSDRSYEDYDVDHLNAWATTASYYGFTGPFYSQLQWDRGITVLDKSIGLEPGTEWVADLLARNDTLETVGTITVTAVLLDDEGQEIGRVQGTSDVPEARPGEPVPVRLTSDTAAGQVASVKFEANAGPPSGGTERRLRFIVDPNPAPYGHEEPQQRIDYSERDLGAPLPYLECMAVTPTDKEVTVSDVDNVLAWQDGQGRIVYVAKAFPVSEPSMTKFGDQTPYCVSVGDPDIAKELMGFATLWWGVGEMS